MSSLYKTLQFPINVYAHSLYLQEGHVDYLHYGLFQDGEIIQDVSISAIQQRATDLLLSYLPPPPSRILEIGVGFGTTAQNIAGQGYNITAITPNPKEIYIAKQSIENQVALECVRFEEFAAPKEKYDVILLQESAQYISPSILFNKAYYLLAKEGIVLLADEIRLKPPAKTLPLLTEIQIQAQRCGFRLTDKIDLSRQATPSVEYLIWVITKHRAALVSDLDLTQQKLDGLLMSLQDMKQKYEKNHYGYFLLNFSKKSATSPRTRGSREKNEQATNSKKPIFTFRPYQAGDEAIIQTSFDQVFPAYRNQEIWEWIYKKNPDGARIMLAIAENGDLAAHYASSVHQAIWRGQTTTIGFIRDVFSSPDYRTFTEGRRGVFIENFEAFLDEWTGPHQLVMLYGFPSQRPFRLGRLLMQYQPFSHWYSYRYRIPVALQQYDTLGLIQEIKQFDSAYDRLWEKRAPQYQFAVSRTARFLNWRFIDIPHKKYWIWQFSPFLSTEVLGYVVIAPEKPQAKLIDFCFPEEVSLAQSFWQQVIDILRWRGVKSIETWFSGASSPHIIEALGFKAQARPDYMIPVFRLFHPELELQWLDANFYYTMADSDFY
jgi:cyclopropane fatty-acyl-phospholipid synthase-like methyltransferase